VVEGEVGWRILVTDQAKKIVPPDRNPPLRKGRLESDAPSTRCSHSDRMLNVVDESVRAEFDAEHLDPVDGGGIRAAAGARRSHVDPQRLAASAG